MSTKPTVSRYRIRRRARLVPDEITEMVAAKAADDSQTTEVASGEQPHGHGNAELNAPEPKAPKDRLEQAQQPQDQAGGAAPATGTPAEEDPEIAALKREGLTARQLRLARRVAQKKGIAADSDYAAVLKLRALGVDPFQRSHLLELVVPDSSDEAGGKPEPQPEKSDAEIQLPQTMINPSSVGSQAAPSPLDQRVGEIQKMQRDLARRRRRSLMLLMLRLVAFILLPTLMAGYYFYQIATPLYATKSEFVIQKSSAAGAAGGAGFGSLFQGTAMATQQDSITVQSYLLSREAMLRLDDDFGFRTHFSDPSIDSIQRLEQGSSLTDAYRIYRRNVKIGYDPTEGLIKMEVLATSPELSEQFSKALIGYAEEQVDNMTARLRRDQMKGALESYEQAEQDRNEALERLVTLQAEAEVLDPVAESAALTKRISGLEAQRDELSIQLASLKDNRRPNQARVEGTEASIARIDEQIATLRSQINSSGGQGLARTEINANLRQAEEDYQFRLKIVAEALAMMETSRIEANRQVRYLSLSVSPIAPDEPTYPRSFENTMVALAIFAGIYLFISLTFAILREQVN